MTVINVNSVSGINSITAQSNSVTFYSSSGGLASITDYLGNNLSVPPGTIITVASSTAPTGYIKANGAELLITTYTTLYNALTNSGATFPFGANTNGSGVAGSTHFRLPDLRGQFIRGFDDGAGVDSGRTFGSSQTDAFQGHKHQTNRGVLMVAGVDAPYDFRSQIADSRDAASYDFATETQVAPVTDGTNGTPRTAAETRPKNIAILYCIKY